MLRWFGHLRENGGGTLGKENRTIQCIRCEVKRKARNRMDGRCEER